MTSLTYLSTIDEFEKFWSHSKRYWNVSTTVDASCRSFLFCSSDEVCFEGVFDSLSCAALDFSRIVHLWKLNMWLRYWSFLESWNVILTWSIYSYIFFFTLGPPQVDNGVACRILKFLTSDCCRFSPRSRMCLYYRFTTSRQLWLNFNRYSVNATQAQCRIIFLLL